MANVDPRGIRQLRDLVFCDVSAAERKEYTADDVVEGAIDSITALRGHRDMLEERLALATAERPQVAVVFDRFAASIAQLAEGVLTFAAASSSEEIKAAAQELRELLDEQQRLRAAMRELVQ